MDGLNALMAWFVENEAVLSGVAATVVILGFVEVPEAPAPIADISKPLEPETDRRSVAVLLFVSTSDDKDNEIFADEMTNDINAALGHVPCFFVTSSNSTLVYKGQSIDTRQIGRELGVRHVVEGRV